MPELIARFRGCLLGLAVGDALGARFEGQPADSIRRRFPSPQAFVDGFRADSLDTHGMHPGLAAAMTSVERPAFDRLVYTDDAQMAIGVAEALLAHQRPGVEEYAAAFVRNYEPWRGYGRGARYVLERIGEGVAPDQAAVEYFPEGSFGNGAAMRVAPVGLRFAHDPGRLIEQARASALSTHAHPLGIEGAVLIARAVGLTLQMEQLDPAAFFDHLLAAASCAPFQAKLAQARTTRREEIGALGNGIEALESVPASIACFASSPGSFVDAVGGAVLLGGDTDTIAAMTGALSGAFLGEEAIPASWLDALEDEGKGRTYIRSLADQLLTRCGR